MATAPIPGRTEVIYPDSDGEPIAENTLQFNWIAKINGGLNILFKDDPNVFVAADLLWYPVQGDNTTRTAPDAMVAFGRPKGHRGSYRQWEEGGIAPQVVIEVRSHADRFGRMLDKFEFYERYQVQEYYLYHPNHFTLEGWLRADGRLREIPEMDGWVSPLLSIRFDLSAGELRMIGPDGRPFATYVELAQQIDEARRRRDEILRDLARMGHASVDLE